METFAGIESEPVTNLDPSIFADPQNNHIRDGVWTKTNSSPPNFNPARRLKSYINSISKSIN